MGRIKNAAHYKITQDIEICLVCTNFPLEEFLNSFNSNCECIGAKPHLLGSCKYFDGPIDLEELGELK